MKRVVRPRRFERLTYSSGGCRSIQLSYGRVYLFFPADFLSEIEQISGIITGKSFKVTKKYRLKQELELP